MAGEKVTATKRKAGGKVVIKKRAKKFRRHQSDQFMRVPVRALTSVSCHVFLQGVLRAEPLLCCCCRSSLPPHPVGAWVLGGLAELWGVG